MRRFGSNAPSLQPQLRHILRCPDRLRQTPLGILIPLPLFATLDPLPVRGIRLMIHQRTLRPFRLRRDFPAGDSLAALQEGEVVGDVDDGELAWAGVETGGDDGFVLGGVEGAGGVHQPASGFEHVHRALQDTELQSE